MSPTRQIGDSSHATERKVLNQKRNLKGNSKKGQKKNNVKSTKEGGKEEEAFKEKTRRV